MDFRFLQLLEQLALAMMVAAILSVGVMQHARGQHADHPEDLATHETFYSDWMRPDMPSQSCCSKNDCYPAEFKKVGGTWFAQRREDGEWMPIPASKFEENRDNPDGRNHVCMQPPGRNNMVFCAILGFGG